MKKVKELKKWIELYNEVHAAAEELQLAYDYVKEGIYVLSGSRDINWDDFADLQPGDMADDTANHPIEIGGRLYVHMKDQNSADKYYLLVSCK